MPHYVNPYKISEIILDSKKPKAKKVDKKKTGLKLKKKKK